MNKLKINWTKRIPDKKALIEQLSSLKEEAILMMRSGIDTEIFAKDRDALFKAIQILKEVI